MTRGSTFLLTGTFPATDTYMDQTMDRSTSHNKLEHFFGGVSGLFSDMFFGSAVACRHPSLRV